MEPINLDELTIEQLKAHAFDLFMQREQILQLQNTVPRINDQINAVADKIKEKTLPVTEVE